MKKYRIKIQPQLILKIPCLIRLTPCGVGRCGRAIAKTGSKLR